MCAHPPFSTQTQGNEPPSPSPSSTNHQQFKPKCRTILDEISYLELSISAGVPVTGNLTHYQWTLQKHEEFLLGNPRQRTPPRLPLGCVGTVEDENWREFCQESALQSGRWVSSAY
jgi:hypothetical protein